MNVEKIDAQMAGYIRTREMVNPALIIRKNNEAILNKIYGSLDARRKQPVLKEFLPDVS